jgi:ectoine hydroxylase-related dioxygenase (phytanoyl-CoA dioxygenase family)
MTSADHAGLDRDGFSLVAGVIDPAGTDRLRAAAAEVLGDGSRRRAGVRFLVRRHPAFSGLGEDRAVRGMVEPVLGSGAFIVRSILFDKSPDANWDVVWHQDTTIPVTEKRDIAGFGPWSVKDGSIHVQPPASVLKRMLTVRIHLDDCGSSNGALLIVPGSHRRGILAECDIDATACEAQSVVCEANAGDALLMRPLVLHASKKAATPRHRRIIHLEFAAEPLPGGLSWGSG